MFDLHAPWWEFPLRAMIIYSALLVMVRVSGRRTVGQFTPFDLLVVMLLSESVSSGLNGGEESVTGGLLAAATLVVLNVVIAFATSRSARLQTRDGRPARAGRARRENIRRGPQKHRVPMATSSRPCARPTASSPT
jgi:hypothetical protein